MSKWQVKLLYDGDCPFCHREVAWLRRRDREGRLALEDISAVGFDPARYGLSWQEVRGVLHGVLPDGRVVRRVEAIRQAYRRGGARLAGGPHAIAGRLLAVGSGLRHICPQSDLAGQNGRQIEQ